VTAHSDLRGQVPARTKPRTGKVVVRVALAGILVALVLGGLWGFDRFRDKAIADFFAGNKPPPTPVAVTEVKLETIPRHLAGIGTLAAVRAVTVAPEVAGRIVSISFEGGARVKAGDPLVQLNDKTERAELQAQRAQGRLAELNLARSRELLERQAAAKATVDQQQAQLDELTATMQRTDALIGYKLIRAPFDGLLGIRHVDVGQFVNTGTPVVTLTDLSRLYVNFSLPEQARSQLVVGQEAQIAVDAFPGRFFAARVTAIEPQVDAETRAIRVQATMDNPENALLPGMFANVRVTLPPQDGAVTVPATAIDFTLYGDTVFAVREEKGADGKAMLKAVRVPVKIGARVEDRVVVAEGLKPGERIVASGQVKLINGAAVVVSEANALASPGALPRY
jgi:multidrug efflux system membrane fusion protein